MSNLRLDDVNDETIAGIASCIDKIEELQINHHHVTMHGWEILSTAINNRPTPVCRQKSLLVYITSYVFILLCKMVEF